MDEELRIPDQLPEDFQATAADGLTQAEAEIRRKEGLDNRVKADPGRSVWQIIGSNLFTLFNGLNVALALCLAWVGSYRNMLFMGVVLTNTLVGTIQELRARHTIRKLQLLNAPTAHVLREGREMACAAEDVVQDDLVILRAGDQIVADAVVVSGGGAVDEALLTGESDPVRKREGDWLLSGSFVTEGRITAQLVHVGNSSYAARLTRSAKAIKRPKSMLMTDLNRIIRVVSSMLIPLGLLLFLKQIFVQDAPVTSAVPSTVAAMIGMIPEGLLLLVSIAMAAGVVKLGRRNTLVQELYGIETLARADVLCLDKTGTMTTGDMMVEKLIALDADEVVMTRQLSRFLGAFDLHSGTLDALREKVPPAHETPLAVLPFSSERKKSAASFADGVTLILGAPEFVLGEGYAPVLRTQVETYARQGSRVLVLAEAKGVVTENDAPPVMRVLGLCLLTDCIRDHASETLRYFREQGVTVKVISGDDPRTVSAVACKVELVGWDSWVDASKLSDDALRQAGSRYTVFGRVTPEQKKKLVEALKQEGHSVAMTGDGVNDIPALKAADCSIAMAGGADAAKRVAQLTLLDADFASMPAVVLEGRRVVNNISRAASLFLVKTLYSFALTILMLMLPANYPFRPIQLTLISSLTIGIPSFFLALEPNRERIQGKFLDSVLIRAVPGAAGVTVCAVLSMMTEHLGWNTDVCSTLAALSAGVMGLMILLGCCWPLNPLRAALWLAMAGGFALAAVFAENVFFMVPLSPVELLVMSSFVAAGLLTLWLTRRLIQSKQRCKTEEHSAKAA